MLPGLIKMNFYVSLHNAGDLVGTYMFVDSLIAVIIDTVISPTGPYFPSPNNQGS